MKKKLLIICPLVVLILVAAGTLLFFYSIRQVNWWGKPPVSPDSIGSEWVSEDGSLSLSTHEKVDAANYYTQGSLYVGDEEIPIYIRLGHEGYFYVLLNDKPFDYQGHFETLEKWEGIDYEETDTEVIIILEVQETTYYTEGQEIKLIYKKNK